MKNKNLYQFHLQLEGIKDNIIYQLIFGRIKDFYKNNGIRLNTLIEKLDKLQQDYFIIENDKIKMTDATEENKSEPIMIEGKSYEDYQKDYSDLMEIDVKIIF